VFCDLFHVIPCLMFLFDNTVQWHVQRCTWD
jgi:hypothetical protein